MIYDKPLLGKLGIKSGVSKNMVFGICADTKKEAFEVLVQKIGNRDVQKYRWHTHAWTKELIDKWLKENEKHLDYLRAREEIKRESKLKLSLIMDNFHRLPKDLQERFDKACYGWRQGSTINHAFNLFVNFLNRS